MDYIRGLAARSGTEFTWSPQLRNLAERDWVPFSFTTNMAENAHIKGRWVFLLGFEFSRVQTSRKGFKNIFKGIFGHQEAWCMNSSWVTTLTVIRHLGKFSLFISFVNFRATSLVSISYIFPPAVVLRTLFLILNICYELTILVWILQQSYRYGNVH